MTGRSFTGVALRARSLEWTAPDKAGDSAPSAQQADLELGADQKDILAALRAEPDRVAQDIHAKCGRTSGPAVIGLPAAWVMLRIADLPAAAPDELQGMVELQVDKFSPFPADESVISYELLSEKEDRCRVLLSAVPTKTANLVGDALRKAGILPKWVDVNLLAWWRILQDAEQVCTTGSQAFVILDDESCDVIVANGGQPIAMRSLSNMDDLTPAEASEEMAREVAYTLASLDLDRTGDRLGEVAVWHRGPPPEDLLGRLAEQFSVAARAYDLATLPALTEGLLRRAENRPRGMLNLAPPAWQQVESAQQTRRRMITLSASVLGLWLLGMAILFGGLQFEKVKLAHQEAILEELKAPADSVRVVREQALALEQYMDRSHSGLECLREVSDLLPPGIELKSFSYHKGKNVEISGEADAITLVYDFKKEMEKSPLFKDTSLPRTMRTQQGRESFKMTATLPGGEKP